MGFEDAFSKSQEAMMITRRDIAIAVVTLATALGAVAVNSQTSVMTSTAVDWNSMRNLGPLPDVQ